MRNGAVFEIKLFFSFFFRDLWRKHKQTKIQEMNLASKPKPELKTCLCLVRRPGSATQKFWGSGLGWCLVNSVWIWLDLAPHPISYKLWTEGKKPWEYCNMCHSFNFLILIVCQQKTILSENRYWKAHMHSCKLIYYGIMISFPSLGSGSVSPWFLKWIIHVDNF